MNKQAKVRNGILLSACEFKDKLGYTYKLYPETYKHIKILHPEIRDPIPFIESVFEDTFAIYESKRVRMIYLYYNIKSKNLYRVVVANIVDRRIKTAYISNVIKEGDLKWINKSLLLR